MLAKTPRREFPYFPVDRSLDWPEMKWMFGIAAVTVACLFYQSPVWGSVGLGIALMTIFVWTMGRVYADLERWECEQNPGLAEHIMNFDGKAQLLRWEQEARRSRPQ